MKQTYKIWTMVLMLTSRLGAQEINIQRLDLPEISTCWTLFSKFNQAVCAPSGSQQSLDPFLKTMFEQEMAAYSDQSESMIFLSATFMDQIIGYVSCQVVGDDEVFVRQLAIDPEKYDCELVKELLFAIFEIMPQIKHLSVQCPAKCADLTSLFEYLGFVVSPQEAEDQAGLFVQYDLLVHPKCKICEILYGADFWEQDTDSSQDGDWGSWELKDSEPEQYEIWQASE